MILRVINVLQIYTKSINSNLANKTMIGGFVDSVVMPTNSVTSRETKGYLCWREAVYSTGFLTGTGHPGLRS
jgi:hypothetical protein